MLPIPEEFLSKLERELVKTDPMNRHKVVLEYASLMRVREKSIIKSVLRRLIYNYALIKKANPMSTQELDIKSHHYNIFASDVHAWAILEGKRLIYNIVENSEILGKV